MAGCSNYERENGCYDPKTGKLCPRVEQQIKYDGRGVDVDTRFVCEPSGKVLRAGFHAPIRLFQRRDRRGS